MVPVAVKLLTEQTESLQDGKHSHPGQNKVMLWLCSGKEKLCAMVRRMNRNWDGLMYILRRNIFSLFVSKSLVQPSQSSWGRELSGLLQ